MASTADNRVTITIIRGDRRIEVEETCENEDLVSELEFARMIDHVSGAAKLLITANVAGDPVPF